MNINLKKKSTAVVTIIAVAAILLSGTFAYVLNNQHRSDYLSAEDRIYDLTLINNFTQYGEQDWNNNKTVLNPVQIKSSANTADETYVNAYVAVQLMEYLDVYTRGDWLTVGEVLASSLVGTVGTSFNANNTDQALFAIDDNGDYMTYTAATSQFGADYIVEYNGFAMFNGSQTLVQGTAIYGIHGKPMRDEKSEYTYGNPTPYEHVQANGAENQVNAECDATVIEGWGVETPAVEAREYVSFLLDETNDVMLLSDWQVAYAADDTDPALTGAFWIIDDVNGTGWAYWAQALAPGAETSNLLESITLEKEISKIDYYMHVDMASASLDEIDVLAGAKTANGCEMPEELIAILKNPTVVPFSFIIDTAIDFDALVNEIETETGSTIGTPEISPGKEMTLLIPDHANNNFYVDWGDGTRSAQITQTAGNLETEKHHEYAEHGVYTISITGEFPGGITFMDQNEGKIEVGLTDVLTPFPKFEMVDYMMGFYYCLSLKSIPGNLFINNPQLTSFTYTFYGTALEEIPSDLFSYTIDAESFDSTFMVCRYIEKIPTGLFWENQKAIHYFNTFCACTSLKEIEEKVFRSNEEVAFSNTFGNCRSLTTVPSDFLDDCVNTKYIDSIFYDCAALETVPSNIFSNNHNISYAGCAFEDCINLQELPELWNRGWNIPYAADVFKDCTSAINYQDAVDNGWAI